MPQASFIRSGDRSSSATRQNSVAVWKNRRAVCVGLLPPVCPQLHGAVNHPTERKRAPADLPASTHQKAVKHHEKGDRSHMPHLGRLPFYTCRGVPIVFHFSDLGTFPHHVPAGRFYQDPCAAPL